MTLFGLCKGCYDANIWAGLYDVVPPRARATAVGIMNTVGWGGGAMAPWAFGSFAKRGGGTEIENMSHAISFGGAIYLAAAAILFGAVIFRARRDIPLTQTDLATLVGRQRRVDRRPAQEAVARVEQLGVRLADAGDRGRPRRGVGQTVGHGARLQPLRQLEPP